MGITNGPGAAFVDFSNLTLMRYIYFDVSNNEISGNSGFAHPLYWLVDVIGYRNQKNAIEPN